MIRFLIRQCLVGRTAFFASLPPVLIDAHPRENAILRNGPESVVPFFVDGRYPYGAIERSLGAVFGADTAIQRGALRGRLKRLSTLGLPRCPPAKAHGANQLRTGVPAVDCSPDGGCRA